MELEMEDYLDNFARMYDHYCEYTEMNDEMLDKKMDIGFEELFDIIDCFRNYRFNGFVEKIEKKLD